MKDEYTDKFMELSTEIEDINTIPDRMRDGTNLMYVNHPTETMIAAYRCARHGKEHYHMIVQSGPQESMMITRTDVGELLAVLPLQLEDFRFLTDAGLDAWGDYMEREEYGTSGVHYHGVTIPPFPGMVIDFGNMGAIVHSILKNLGG